MPLLAGDKKAVASLILKKMQGGSTADELKNSNDKFVTAPTNENGDEIDADMGLKTAAQEIMAAVESKDAGSLRSALSSFVEMANDSTPDSSEESSE